MPHQDMVVIILNNYRTKLSKALAVSIHFFLSNFVLFEVHLLIMQ